MPDTGDSNEQGSDERGSDGVGGRRIDPIVARRRVAAVAGHTGDAATARAMLDDPEPGVRATALGALHRIGQLDRAELLDALHDPSPTVLRRACAVATTWGGIVGDAPDPAVADAVAALLDHPDDTVVETAAWACGERPPASAPVLARLCAIGTGHFDSLCREAAIAALGALGDERGLSSILAATADRATVRRRAILALAPFSGPEVDAALERALEDRDWQVRQAAEDLRAPGQSMNIDRNDSNDSMQ